MHAGDRLKRENLRRDHLAKPHLARAGQNQLRPLRLLEGRDKFAEQQLAGAVVQEMVRAVDCFHAVDPFRCRNKGIIGGAGYASSGVPEFAAMGQAIVASAAGRV